MSEPLTKFQGLLRELFQFDSADLDFGLYRIMNHKRSVVERFIERDLPLTVRKALEKGALKDQSRRNDVEVDGWIVSATPLPDLKKQWNVDWNEDQFAERHIVFPSQGAKHVDRILGVA
jgi:hypothetical protein